MHARPQRFSVLIAILAGLPAMCAAAAVSPEITAVIELAHGAPPEIAADALTRAASLDRLENKRRIELLDEAFALASGSPQPYKRRSGLDRNEGPAGFLSRAYRQDLDAQSLRLRAIEGLVALDPAKARRYFSEMPPLQLTPLTCEDFLVYDVDRFYEMLGLIAAKSFTAAEARDHEPARFLGGYLAAIHSPAQVAPAARLLAGAGLSDSDFQAVATAFAGALARISGDDRSFSYSAPAAGEAVLALAQAGERRQLPMTVLTQAYRQFLVNHMTATRCVDRRVGNQNPGPEAFFNDHFGFAQVQPIGEAESTPAKLEGEAKGLQWCEDAECKAVRAQYQALIHRADGAIYQERERDLSEWQSKVPDFLNALAAWTQSSGATDAEHFREKVGFYSDLLVLVPNGATREFVLRSLLQFLAGARLPAENRLEWLLPVRQLVGRVSLDPLGLGRLAGDLGRSQDPVIALSMALETLSPLPVGETMLLL